MAKRIVQTMIVLVIAFGIARPSSSATLPAPALGIPPYLTQAPIFNGHPASDLQKIKPKKPAGSFDDEMRAVLLVARSA